MLTSNLFGTSPLDGNFSCPLCPRREREKTTGRRGVRRFKRMGSDRELKIVASPSYKKEQKMEEKQGGHWEKEHVFQNNVRNKESSCPTYVL